MEEVPRFERDDRVRIMETVYSVKLGIAGLKGRVHGFTSSSTVTVKLDNGYYQHGVPSDQLMRMPEEMAVAIKQCPFCNAQGILRHDFECYRVTCSFMDCPVSPQTPVYSSMEAAISAWNLRGGKKESEKGCTFGGHENYMTCPVCGKGA